jgi:hypothetical protein
MKLNVKNLKLKDELGNFLALIKYELEKVTASALSGKPVAREMVDLTKCFEAATRSHIAIEKADKKREDSLSPEEELEEIKIYLMSFTHSDRLEIINDLIGRHNKKCLTAKKPHLIREIDRGV